MNLGSSQRVSGGGGNQAEWNSIDEPFSISLSDHDSENEHEDPSIPLTSASSFNRRSLPFASPAMPVQSQSDFGIMLQQQQSMLLKVIQQQEKIIEQQAQFTDRLDGVEESVASFSSHSEESTSKPAERQKVSRELTVSIDHYKSWNAIKQLFYYIEKNTCYP